VPKTVQIRNLDDDLYAALRQRAAAIGISVPALLRKHAKRLVQFDLVPPVSMQEWLDRIGDRVPPVCPIDVMSALDELRGPWPEQGD
jgi:antitoxin FitA